jgi:hypothetical protein
MSERYGMTRMYWIDQVLYPKFAAYVRNDLPSVAKVGAIKRAFEKYGQLDGASLKRALEWGNDPLINVTDLTYAYGEFTPDSSSNEVRIDVDLVKDFEAGRDWVTNKQGLKLHLAGATILHEMVHWADDQDGVDYPGEEGELFEQAVYGKVTVY